MEKNLEQCYAIKFCVKLGKIATETLGMLKDAYGDAAMSRSTIFECHTALIVREFLAQDCHVVPPPVLSRSCTAGLFPLSSAQAEPQGQPIQFLTSCHKGRDGISEGDPGKRVPEGVCALGITLHALCQSTRVLFRGILKIFTDMFNKKN